MKQLLRLLGFVGHVALGTLTAVATIFISTVLVVVIFGAVIMHFAIGVAQQASSAAVHAGYQAAVDAVATTKPVLTKAGKVQCGKLGPKDCAYYRRTGMTPMFGSLDHPYHSTL